MGRWIAYDEESTAVAAAQSGMAVSFQRGDALENALAASKAAFVLLPGNTRNDALLLELKFKTPHTSPIPSARSANKEPVTYEATGFLGLSDERVFEDQPAAPKKWWKRLLD